MCKKLRERGRKAESKVDTRFTKSYKGEKAIDVVSGSMHRYRHVSLIYTGLFHDLHTYKSGKGLLRWQSKPNFR